MFMAKELIFEDFYQIGIFVFVVFHGMFLLCSPPCDAYGPCACIETDSRSKLDLNWNQKVFWIKKTSSAHNYEASPLTKAFEEVDENNSGGVNKREICVHNDLTTQSSLRVDDIVNVTRNLVRILML